MIKVCPYMNGTLLTLVVAVLMTGCSKKNPEQGPTQKLPVAAVRVEKVVSLKRMATEEAVGTVRPKLSASISAKVSGTIQQMLVVPGQTVRAGELLVCIDAREIQARLDQAQAVREQTEKELARLDKLVKQGVATQQEFENVQARFRVADATVIEAQTMLGYTKISAPFSGVITSKQADVGDLAAPGKSLLQLEDPATLRFEADVSDALIWKIKLGDKLTVRLSGNPAAIEGAVAEMAPVADPLTRTFCVKLEMPAVDGMRSGQFGRALVPVSEVDAIRIPVSAVIVRGQMEIAFVVVDQRAQMRLVKTGKHLDQEVEILSGLSVGESLVIEGASQLADGQEVRP